MKPLYLDNAAATPVSRIAQEAMRKAMQLVGNPSALHGAGRQAALAMEQARRVVATFLSVRPEQIIFTASGSEANTISLVRLAEANPKYKHIVTTPIEHTSILEACDALEKKGYQITLLPVDGRGLVKPEDVLGAIQHDTLLVSVMYANNEIGTMEPIAKIGRRIRRFKQEQKRDFPLFHTDACQAALYAPMDVQTLHVDMLTMNSSKVYGPRGLGVLSIGQGIELTPQVIGGPHEWGLRAGTENVPAIVGFGAALGEIEQEKGLRVSRLRDWTIRHILDRIESVRVNGPEGEERFANNINVSVQGVTGEQLVLEMDMHGISIGAGAACTAHETGPSHVIQAIGTPRVYQGGAVRISLGRRTTKTDMMWFLKAFEKSVARVRERNHF